MAHRFVPDAVHIPKSTIRLPPWDPRQFPPATGAPKALVELVDVGDQLVVDSVVARLSHHDKQFVMGSGHTFV